MGEKILVIADASAFRSSACELRTFYSIVQGYRGKLNSNDIEFGTAFHKFRATYRNLGEAGYEIGMYQAREHYRKTPMMVKAKKKYLDEAFLQKVCSGYATKYKHDCLQPVVTSSDIILPGGESIKAGSKLIEPLTRFAFPYYSDDICEILIAGTIDELAKFDGGAYVIVDAKTTSMWDIHSYFHSYKLSPQLKTYRWAIRKYAERYPDSFIAAIDKATVGALIDGIFYKGADAPIEYVRSETYHSSESDLEEFEELVTEKIYSLVQHIHAFAKTGNKPLRYGLLNGACETPYGHCPYFEVCCAPDEESRDCRLESSFKKELYNPLKHGE